MEAANDTFAIDSGETNKINLSYSPSHPPRPPRSQSERLTHYKQRIMKWFCINYSHCFHAKMS